jgi:hypothetical protein
VRAAGEEEVVAVVVVVVAGELVVVVADDGEVVLGDLVLAGDFVVAGDGDVFAEVCAYPTAGRAARSAIARIERIGFMEWSFLF